MFDSSDAVFAEALERTIRLTLFGDDKQLGLYRTLRNAQSWESFQRASGVIEGYEQTLNLIWQIKRRMNGEDVPPMQDRRVN